MEHLDAIHASLRLMFSKLGVSAIAKFRTTVSPPQTFLLRKSAERIEAAELITAAIAQHLGLLGCRFHIKFCPNLPVPARIGLGSGADFPIEIHEGHTDDAGELAGILAHELTHVFLHRSRLSFADTLSTELLTDTAAAFLGLGVLILNEYTDWIDVRARSQARHTKAFGYLTPDEFGYVIAKRQRLFGDNPRVQLMGAQARRSFGIGKALVSKGYSRPPLFKAGRLAKAVYRRRMRNVIAGRASAAGNWPYEFVVNGLGERSVKVIFSCPLCRQLLRVPAMLGAIEVRCSICEQKHLLRT